jgi:ABC-type antimicrobial peptide transport system permease subunit
MCSAQASSQGIKIAETEWFQVRQTSFAEDIWRRFQRNRLALVGGGIVLILCVVAVFAV